MSGDELTRRRMMRNATAAVGAATLAGSAGCLGSLPFVGGGAGAYKKWLPDPGELNSESDHYRFSYIDMSTIVDNEDEFDEGTIEDIEGVEDIWSPVSVDWDETSDLIFFQAAYVVQGDFSKDDVVSDLEDEDWDDDTDHEGFTIMLDEGEDRGMAVSDGTIVITSAFQGDPVDQAETIIDTSNGDEDRYVDEEEDMKALVNALGGGTVVRGGTMEEVDEGQAESGRFDHQVAQGRTMRVNGETSKVRYVVVYEEKDDVDTGDLEDWVEENEDTDQEFDDVEDVSYKQNGRTGIIEGTMDTDEF